MDSDPSHLDPRVTWLWRLHGLFRVGMLWMPVALGGAAGLNAVVGPAPASVFAVTVVAFGVLMAMLWPALRYQHFTYSVREHDLLVQRGVLVRRRSSIPHNRIQHVDTRQGPVERLLGLSSVAVYTAAGMSADGSIPGLAESDAEAIRDELARRGGDDGV